MCGVKKAKNRFSCYSCKLVTLCPCSLARHCLRMKGLPVTPRLKKAQTLNCCRTVVSGFGEWLISNSRPPDFCWHHLISCSSIWRHKRRYPTCFSHAVVLLNTCKQTVRCKISTLPLLRVVISPSHHFCAFVFFFLLLAHVPIFKPAYRALISLVGFFSYKHCNSCQLAQHQAYLKVCKITMNEDVECVQSLAAKFKRIKWRSVNT